jgi:hypothetical protein
MVPVLPMAPKPKYEVTLFASTLVPGFSQQFFVLMFPHFFSSLFYNAAQSITSLGAECLLLL